MRVTIAVRLVGLVAAGVLAVGVVAGVAGWASADQQRNAHRMAEISTAMSRQWNADMMHDTMRADVLAALAATDERQRVAYGATAVAEHATTMLENLDAARTGAPAALLGQYDQVRPEVADYGALAARIVTAAATDRRAAEALMPRFMAAFDTLEEQLGAVDDAMSAAVTAQKTATLTAGRNATWIILVAFAVGSLALALLSLAIVRSVMGPIRHMSAQLARVAGGDLLVTCDTGRGDELGDLARSVDATVAAVREGFSVMAGCAGALTTQSEGLRTASAELSAAAEETSTRAAQSVQLAERVADGAGEVASGIRTVSQQTGEISGSAATAAGVGDRARDGAQVAAEAITRLGDSSTQISGVASMIRSISDQTRLLALNATIEAARAGDAGRGFAVVASEVKDLAQEVGRATEDISGRIEAIQQEVAEAVRSIDGVTTVIAEITTHQSDITGAVTAQAGTSARVEAQIASASQDAADIAQAIAGISAAAEQTTTTAQVARVVAGEIADAATQMRATLQSFVF